MHTIESNQGESIRALSDHECESVSGGALPFVVGFMAISLGVPMANAVLCYALTRKTVAAEAPTINVAPSPEEPSVHIR